MGLIVYSFLVVGFLWNLLQLGEWILSKPKFFLATAFNAFFDASTGAILTRLYFADPTFWSIEFTILEQFLLWVNLAAANRAFRILFYKYMALTIKR